jgi:diadenosine tetraphosphate (Ap4A) HIT family hydrolase
MLAAMTTHPRTIALLFTLAVAPTAMANPPPAGPPAPPAKTETAAPNAAAGTPAEKKKLMHQMRDEREKMVRERGEIFARIANKHDYTGEYVVFRDKDVTAFLDIKDPAHPRYKPGHDEGPPVASSMQRAHILVVPNEPRETIGKTLASDITAEDLELTLKVMNSAKALAAKLKIKDPKIYVKSPERVGVGYLHVHILGQRDPKAPYPPALK